MKIALDVSFYYLEKYNCKCFEKSDFLNEHTFREKCCSIQFFWPPTRIPGSYKNKTEILSKNNTLLQ